MKILASPRAGRILEKSWKTCLIFILNRMKQLIAALRKLVKSVDSLLAIDNLQVFASHASHILLDMVKIYEGQRIVSHHGIDELLSLRGSPNYSSLVLGVCLEHPVLVKF
jgi:hypothetical protein